MCGTVNSIARRNTAHAQASSIVNRTPLSDTASSTVNRTPSVIQHIPKPLLWRLLGIIQRLTPRNQPLKV